MIRYFRAMQYYNHWLQLLFFVVLTAGLLILFSFAGQLVSVLFYGFPAYREALALLSSPGSFIEEVASVPPSLIRILAITQIFSQVGLFVIPPLVFSWLVMGNSAPEFLMLNRKPGLFTVLMVLALLILMLPAVTWLTEINMKVPLPAFLIRAEDNANQVIQLFFNDPATGRFILNIFMVAIIPAIGEELFFRGILQKYFILGTRNIHIGVIITAFIFSFFHFQFQGFIPRFALGLLFGYLMVWTGTLWVPVIAHFINNGAAVIIEFLNQKGLVTTGYEEFGSYTGTAFLVLSFLFTFLICFLIWYVEKKTKAVPVKQETGSLMAE